MSGTTSQPGPLASDSHFLRRAYRNPFLHGSNRGTNTMLQANCSLPRRDSVRDCLRCVQTPVGTPRFPTPLTEATGRLL